MTWLLNTHSFSGSRASMFRMLHVPLVRHSRLLLGIVLLLRSHHLILLVGDVIHHMTRHFSHPPAGVRIHQFHLLRMMLLFQSHLPLMMLLIQCHLRRVRLLRILSQMLLEKVQLIYHYFLCIQTILPDISGTKR